MGLFSKKTNPQEEELKFNKKLNTHSNIMSNALPQQAIDEQKFLEEEDRLADLTRWQQDLEPEITKLVHDLRREYLDNEGVWQKEKGFDGKSVKPICNDLLIRKIITLLRPSMSRNLMMSNYSEERILNRLKSIVLTFIFHLGSNYKMYAISEDDLPYIVQLFKDVIDPTYYRALNNGERNYHRTISKRIEAISTTGDRNKKGIFNM